MKNLISLIKVRGMLKLKGFKITILDLMNTKH